MYSVSDIEQILEQYINSPDGQKILENNGIINADAKVLVSIATRLKEDIITAFLLQTKHGYMFNEGRYTTPDPSLPFEGNNVNISTKQTKNSISADITFKPSALHRNSLWCVDKSTGAGAQTGKGVNDIFELFTHGVNYHKHVYGLWGYNNYNNPDKYDEIKYYTVRSRKYRAPNNFIQRVIERYKTMYPQLTINYPSTWGGNVPTKHQF